MCGKYSDYYIGICRAIFSIFERYTIMIWLGATKWPTTFKGTGHFNGPSVGKLEESVHIQIYAWYPVLESIKTCMNHCMWWTGPFLIVLRLQDRQSRKKSCFKRGQSRWHLSASFAVLASTSSTLLFAAITTAAVIATPSLLKLSSSFWEMPLSLLHPTITTIGGYSANHTIRTRWS